MPLDSLMPGLLDEIAADRAEIEPQTAALLTERAPLAAMAKQTKRAHEDADNRFHAIELRIGRATRHGADDLSVAAARIIDRYRRARDVAGAAMTKAKLMLENHDWRIGNLRADLAQLELIANPPTRTSALVEIVKRPLPPFHDGSFETIELPPARAVSPAEPGGSR
jgi:hypothetical protein